MFQLASPYGDGKQMFDKLTQFIIFHGKDIIIEVLTDARSGLGMKLRISSVTTSENFILAPFLESIKVVDITIGDSN